MKTIYKYEIEISDYVEIEMFEDAQVLDAQVQFGQVCLWAIVDTEKEKEFKKFRIVGTGHEIKENPILLNHIGTFQTHGGNLVFHIFEIYGK